MRLHHSKSNKKYPILRTTCRSPPICHTHQHNKVSTHTHTSTQTEGKQHFPHNRGKALISSLGLDHAFDTNTDTSVAPVRSFSRSLRQIFSLALGVRKIHIFLNWACIKSPSLSSLLFTGADLSLVRALVAETTTTAAAGGRRPPLVIDFSLSGLRGKMWIFAWKSYELVAKSEFRLKFEHFWWRKWTGKWKINAACYDDDGVENGQSAPSLMSHCRCWRLENWKIWFLTSLSLGVITFVVFYE